MYFRGVCVCVCVRLCLQGGLNGGGGVEDGGGGGGVVGEEVCMVLYWA